MGINYATELGQALHRERKFRVWAGLGVSVTIDFHGTKRPKDFRSESRQKIE